MKRPSGILKLPKRRSAPAKALSLKQFRPKVVKPKKGKGVLGSGPIGSGGTKGFDPGFF